MRRCATAFALGGVLFATSGVALAAGEERVPVYTREDLDRMFGPPPPGPFEPVDRSTPDDWLWVERFLDRQYARIDADRQHDLDQRAIDIAERRTRPISPYFGGSVAWSLGYPAYTWWSNVHGRYAHATAPSRSSYGSDHGSDRGHGGGRRK